MDEYLLVQDEDSHWYVIPADRELDWWGFCDLDHDDPEWRGVPGWAKPVGGSYTLVKFKEYRIT